MHRLRTQNDKLKTKSFKAYYQRQPRAKKKGLNARINITGFRRFSFHLLTVTQRLKTITNQKNLIFLGILWPKHPFFSRQKTIILAWPAAHQQIREVFDECSINKPRTIEYRRLPAKPQQTIVHCKHSVTTEHYLIVGCGGNHKKTSWRDRKVIFEALNKFPSSNKNWYLTQKKSSVYKLPQTDGISFVTCVRG